MRIRIIPMSIEDSSFTGKTIDDVQNEYFNDYLINVEKGWYYYAKSGLDSNEGDLLLFQMGNTIIASAIFKMVLKFPKPTPEGNRGALLVKDVKTFKPITKEELSNIINGFKSFTQAKLDFKEEQVNLEKLNARIGM